MTTVFRVSMIWVFTLAGPAFGQLTGGEIGWVLARQQDQIASLRASLTNQPVDPFRKVKKAYWDLRPIFQWDKEYARHRLSALLGNQTREVTPRPLPFWKSDYRTVSQVLNDGLLLSDYHGDLVFLTNYPNFKTLKDGDKIGFLAITNGTFRFLDTQQAQRTIESLDYGIAYNPFELQRNLQMESKKTNGPKNK